VSRRIRIFLLVVLLLASFVIARLSGFHDLLSVEGMRQAVAGWGSLAPFLYVLVCIAAILLQMPGSVYLSVGGALFGWKAIAYGWIGAMIGTMITFLIVRYLAHDYVQRAVREKFRAFRRVDDYIRARGFVAVLGLRVVLGLSPPLNWSIGATSVRVGSFVAGTALGVVPGIALFVSLGGSLATASETGDYWTPAVVIPVALLLLLLVVTTVAARRFLAPGTPPEAPRPPDEASDEG
jgi:uncharacterized membrane protein YdjX (TVP38/TMEM64 family)